MTSSASTRCTQRQLSCAAHCQATVILPLSDAVPQHSPCSMTTHHMSSCSHMYLIYSIHVKLCSWHQESALQKLPYCAMLLQAALSVKGWERLPRDEIVTRGCQAVAAMAHEKSRNAELVYRLQQKHQEGIEARELKGHYQELQVTYDQFVCLYTVCSASAPPRVSSLSCLLGWFSPVVNPF